MAIEFRQHDQREETQGCGMEKTNVIVWPRDHHTPLKINIFFTQSYEETWKMMFLLFYSVMSRFNVSFQGCMFFDPPSLQIINHHLHPQIVQTCPPRISWPASMRRLYMIPTFTNIQNQTISCKVNTPVQKGRYGLLKGSWLTL